jgi:hypothetical protein
MSTNDQKLLEWDDLPEKERASLSDINYIRDCDDKNIIIDRINQLSRRCKDRILLTLNAARREDARKAKKDERAPITLDKDILAALGLEWDNIRPDIKKFLTDFKNLRDKNLKSEIIACINLMSPRCRESMLAEINRKKGEEMVAASKEHRAPNLFSDMQILSALGYAQANFGLRGLRERPAQGKEK